MATCVCVCEAELNYILDVPACLSSISCSSAKRLLDQRLSTPGVTALNLCLKQNEDRKATSSMLLPTTGSPKSSATARALGLADVRESNGEEDKRAYLGRRGRGQMLALHYVPTTVPLIPT